jgi:hypothetical protein
LPGEIKIKLGRPLGQQSMLYNDDCIDHKAQVARTARIVFDSLAHSGCDEGIPGTVRCCGFPLLQPCPRTVQADLLLRAASFNSASSHRQGKSYCLPSTRTSYEDATRQQKIQARVSGVRGGSANSGHRRSTGQHAQERDLCQNANSS